MNVCLSNWFLYDAYCKCSKLIYNLHTIAEDVGMNQKWDKLSSHFVNHVSWTPTYIIHLGANTFTYTD